MLYELREWQRAAWAPFIPWLQFTANMLARTANPFHSTPSRQIAAGCDVLARLYERHTKPQFGLTETVIDGEQMPVIEVVAMKKALCRFVHFERASMDAQCVDIGLFEFDPDRAADAGSRERVILDVLPVLMTALVHPSLDRPHEHAADLLAPYLEHGAPGARVEIAHHGYRAIADVGEQECLQMCDQRLRIYRAPDHRQDVPPVDNRLFVQVSRRFRRALPRQRPRRESRTADRDRPASLRVSNPVPAPLSSYRTSQCGFQFLTIQKSQMSLFRINPYASAVDLNRAVFAPNLPHPAQHRQL